MAGHGTRHARPFAGNSNWQAYCGTDARAHAACRSPPVPGDPVLNPVECSCGGLIRTLGLAPSLDDLMPNLTPRLRWWLLCFAAMAVAGVTTWLAWPRQAPPPPLLSLKYSELLRLLENSKGDPSLRVQKVQ